MVQPARVISVIAMITAVGIGAVYVVYLLDVFAGRAGFNLGIFIPCVWGATFSLLMLLSEMRFSRVLGWFGQLKSFRGRSAFEFYLGTSLLASARCVRVSFCPPRRLSAQSTLTPGLRTSLTSSAAPGPLLLRWVELFF